jgi:transcription elongation factor GreA
MLTTTCVRVGSRVRVQDLDGEDELVVVGREESDFSIGRISLDCPLGRALMGHGAGARVAVRAPGGLRSVTILEVG